MKHLAIIYHSLSGGTEALAQAVLHGARQETQVSSRLVRAFDAGIEDLKKSDAIIFGTPENFGYMSGALKDFFDRTYDAALPLQLNLPYAIFISAGNDGSGAVREIDRILRGYPMRRVADPLIALSGKTPGSIAPVKKTSGRILQQCEELGTTMAAGLALGIF